jgi:hypothetical protein
LTFCKCLSIISLQVLLGAFAQLDVADGIFAVPNGLLLNTDVAVLAAQFTCTTAGAYPDPDNCSSFYVCTSGNCGDFLLSQGTCGSNNFDPVAQVCSSTYVCSECQGPGFVCNSNSSFTLCAAAGVPIITNYQCPSGYYCNEICVSPCLNYVPDC